MDAAGRCPSVDAAGPARATASSSARTACPPCTATLALLCPVSRHTGRIHLYSCVPGHDSRPKQLFENFLPEELNSPCSSSDVKARTLLLKKIPAFCNVFRAFIKEWLALRALPTQTLR